MRYLPAPHKLLRPFPNHCYELAAQYLNTRNLGHRRKRQADIFYLSTGIGYLQDQAGSVEFSDSFLHTLLVTANLCLGLCSQTGGGGVAFQQSLIAEDHKILYLFRLTERRLFPNVRPLSSVQHMIGSQATKAMHVVAKYCCPDRTRVGVWSDNRCLQAIETYPKLCRLRAGDALRRDRPAQIGNGPDDLSDAWVCAWIARQFVLSPQTLEYPVCATPPSEGWIWAPRLGL